jgi:hypothetical protein
MSSISRFDKVKEAQLKVYLALLLQEWKANLQVISKTNFYYLKLVSLLVAFKKAAQILYSFCSGLKTTRWLATL